VLRAPLADRRRVADTTLAPIWTLFPLLARGYDTWLRRIVDWISFCDDLVFTRMGQDHLSRSDPNIQDFEKLNSRTSTDVGATLHRRIDGSSTMRDNFKTRAYSAAC